MTTFVVATDSVDASAIICNYLDGRLTAADTVHAVNSQVGGDETTAGEIRDGEEALTVISARLGAVTNVETHQFVRGNDPAEDVLACAEGVDADEIVLSMRDRTRTSKLVFGSVAQAILFDADRPVVSVPRDL